LAAIKGYKVITDEASATVTYMGYAAPNALTSNPVWKILRITISGSTIYTLESADGDHEFNNIWDNRASLSYS
jgi:hypothetical protein